MAHETKAHNNTSPEKTSPLLTASEVAAWLRVSRAYVYTAARQGHLQSIKFGKAVRFDPLDVEAFLKQNRG